MSPLSHFERSLIAFVPPVVACCVEPNPRILELFRIDRPFTDAERVEWEALTGECAANAGDAS